MTDSIQLPEYDITTEELSQEELLRKRVKEALEEKRALETFEFSEEGSSPLPADRSVKDPFKEEMTKKDMDIVLGGTVEQKQQKQSVAATQSKLKAYGFNPGEVDGIYGERTKQAVAAFQEEMGLVPTGNLDPKTTGLLTNLPEKDKQLLTQKRQLQETINSFEQPVQEGSETTLIDIHRGLAAQGNPQSRLQVATYDQAQAQRKTLMSMEQTAQEQRMLNLKQAQLGEKKADMLNRGLEEQLRLDAETQDKQSEIQKRREESLQEIIEKQEKIRKDMEDIAKGKHAGWGIGRQFTDEQNAKGIMMAIGVFLSGFGAALAGRDPSTAMVQFNKLLDADLKRQQNRYNQLGGVIREQDNLYSKVAKQYDDEDSRILAWKNQALHGLKLQTQKQANLIGTEEAKLKAEQLNLQIDSQVAANNNKLAQQHFNNQLNVAKLEAAMIPKPVTEKEKKLKEIPAEAQKRLLGSQVASRAHREIIKHLVDAGRLSLPKNIIDRGWDEIPRLIEQGTASFGYGKRFFLEEEDYTVMLNILRAAENELRSKSGAAINEQEYQRLRKMHPIQGEPVEETIAKLNAWANEINNIRESVKDLYPSERYFVPTDKLLPAVKLPTTGLNKKTNKSPENKTQNLHQDLGFRSIQ